MSGRRLRCPTNPAARALEGHKPTPQRCAAAGSGSCSPPTPTPAFSPGTPGTLTGGDRQGTFLINWDNGSRLGLLPTRTSSRSSIRHHRTHVPRADLQPPLRDQRREGAMD
ncbi:DUF4314 domain-containing protein [Spirillospora sp. CA-142024]|uniref:DUF4314 domain-containing protein n=1 Tax=Spirillospora sp. CA-142024 TaxID=3240036 RepID=UPI003D8C6D2D